MAVLTGTKAADRTDLDQRTANVRDAKVIVPLALAVVLIILIVLLRSLVAPLLLVATVVTTYAGTRGDHRLRLYPRGDAPRPACHRWGDHQRRDPAPRAG